ncbi:hypothetical protein PS2_006702 [Malus domestica]
MEKGGIGQMLGSSQYTDDFSEDLWRTVWEEEEVKEMCRFAGEVGIRGDMLRELRFKWAQEKMEETKFYLCLERLREGDKKAEEAGEEVEGMQGEATREEVKSKVVSLPKRRGKIKYNIYGLDLSDPKIDWLNLMDRLKEQNTGLYFKVAELVPDEKSF